MVLKIIKLVKLLVFLVSFPLHRQKHGSSKASKYGPAIIISYDDGYLTDYTKAFPIHKGAGVKAEVCIISGKVGSEGYMNRNQLLELQEAEWEIVSHGRKHSPLKESFLLSASLKDDNKLAVDHAYRFQKDSECVIGSGNRKEKARIIDINGGYLFLDRKLELQHKRYESFRISDSELLEEVSESKKDLVKMGLNVRNFTFPYNAFAEWSVRAVKECYDSARAESLIPICRGRLNHNVRDCYNRYFLSSYSLEADKMNKEKILGILKSIREKRGICIFYAHTSRDAFNTDLVEFLFTEARKRNIPFVTRSILYK